LKESKFIFWQAALPVPATEPNLPARKNLPDQPLKGADWATPADVKRAVGSASILNDGRAVFNIAGNKYRIVVWINYPYRVVYVRLIGTHRQYDKIDAQTV